MPALMERLDKMIEGLTEAKDEIEKFEDKSNDSAGHRVRKTMQMVKEETQHVRVEIQTIRNERHAAKK